MVTAECPSLVLPQLKYLPCVFAMPSLCPMDSAFPSLGQVPGSQFCPFVYKRTKFKNFQIFEYFQEYSNISRMLMSRIRLADGHSWPPFFLWGAAGSLTSDVQDRRWTSSVQPLKKSGFVESQVTSHKSQVTSHKSPILVLGQEDST